MHLLHIESIDAPEIEIYHQLRDNAFRTDNSFIADSPKVVNLLLESDIEVKSILATQEYYDEFSHLLSFKSRAKFYLSTKEEMQKIVGHKIHHNCMMHSIRPDETPLSELGEHIIMLDSITSTENIGSIARSATALGVDSFIISKQSPHPYQRRALRVSMGYISRLKLYIHDDTRQTILALKKNGYRVYGAEVTADAIELAKVKVSQKWVLIMGHEGNGLSSEILNLCDEVVKIEMQKGVKSFNVSVAASIMMYKFINHN